MTNPIVRNITFRLTSSRVRILAYHGVEEPEVFSRTVDRIIRQYQPVGEDDIISAIDHGIELPRHCVWFTFDDGLKTTIEAGEMLASKGVRATAFVNPSTIETPDLLWFQVRDAAESLGLITDAESRRFSRSRLKLLPNSERQDEIKALREMIEQSGHRPKTLSCSISDLHDWARQGHFVGNHTWDHPLLDTCSLEEQASQIITAHDWLVEHGFTPRIFAYPNGNYTEHAALTAASLGYRATLLFDHALAKVSSSSSALSRLRIDSGADDKRVNAILSGAHSLVFNVGSRLVS